MKKILFQLDTDPIPNTFDTVVAYDGGADHVNARGHIKPSTVGIMVDGAIFTRAPKQTKNTALFVTGSDMGEGEAVLAAIKSHFFGDYRVSVMLDSNGSNITAAAAVAYFGEHLKLAGQRAVMLAAEGAEVVLMSRRLDRAQVACAAMYRQFKVELIPAATGDRESLNAALDGANILLATSAAGAQLLEKQHWKDLPDLEIVVDANAIPPLGVHGIAASDKATEHHSKPCYGAIGFGALKLELQRACVAKLFERNDVILDAPEIFDLAKDMVTAR